MALPQSYKRIIKNRQWESKDHWKRAVETLRATTGQALGRVGRVQRWRRYLQPSASLHCSVADRQQSVYWKTVWWVPWETLVQVLKPQRSPHQASSACGPWRVFKWTRRHHPNEERQMGFLLRNSSEGSEVGHIKETARSSIWPICWWTPVSSYWALQSWGQDALWVINTLFSDQRPHISSQNQSHPHLSTNLATSVMLNDADGELLTWNQDLQ